MNKVQIHTVEQPDSDITCFILSCDRLDLLDRTINSFLRTRDYITKMVLVDDSGKQDIFNTLVDKYGTFCDIIMFPKNRSQWWAMDFMVSYCDTDYIFYLEDDWELLKPGYINASKQILQKHRDIGTVDISWRTFDWQGLDTYDNTLVDDSFYYKKFWRISDYHYQWYGWIGSPNLKRREDLILLGRVEKYYQEIWIDRKFFGLGFKSVYLNGKYVEHLGDNRSRAAPFRHNEHLTPEDKYPKELLANRVYPKFDYHQWDTHWKHPDDITLVTALLDLERPDRTFEQHYVQGLSKVLESRHPVVVYCEEKYFDQVRAIRNDRIQLIPFSKTDLESTSWFNRAQEIINSDDWVSQSAWMKDSVIRSRHYIPLTLHKNALLEQSLNYFNSTYYYWIDSGIYNSYNIQYPINSFYFTRIPKDGYFMTAFPYYSNSEIHGMSMSKMTEIIGKKPEMVCRASFMGGTKQQIQEISTLYNQQVNECLANEIIGAEEAVYTMLALKHPDKFHIQMMQTGDIYNYCLLKLI